MSNLTKALLVSALLFGGSFAFADEHGHKEEHGHGHEEANEAVGPEKGITEHDDEKGFKLSPEAFKTFNITSVDYKAPGSLTLPKTAIFFGLQETNLFRIRDGFYKRIDFKTVSKSKTQYTVTSPDLAPGDRVVLTGVGFLRIVELQAGGGIEDHH